MKNRQERIAYLNRRIAECLESAERAKDSLIAQVHRDFAATYRKALAEAEEEQRAGAPQSAAFSPPAP